MLPDYRVRQRDTLIEITRAITSELDLNAVLRLIVQNAVEVLNGHAGLVALEENAERYHIYQTYGVPAPLLNQLNPTLQKASSVDEARALLERNLTAIAREFGLGLWQIVSLPLRVRNESLGRLYVFRTVGGFSPNDRAVLQMFADQAAIAVHNAQLYAAMNAEKRRLDAVLEFSADGVIIMDAAHRITTFNQALERITDLDGEDVAGHTFEDVVRLENKRAGLTLAEAEANGWPILETKGPLMLEADIVRADGKRIGVEIYFTALFAADGKLAGIVADFHDISRFREADQMKSTFMSVVSHELKTPVAIIKGYASTLNRPDAKWDESLVRDGLSVIEEESDRLTELIDDLLDASRVEAGGLKLTPVELDIDALVTDVIKKMKPQVKTHKLAADVPPDLPLVYADEARIVQVLRNFITNAVKYSPEGKTIRVSSRTTPTEVIITVTDQGSGISAEDQKNLFERFHRVDNALTRKTQGAGLGLFISRAIIEGHKGRIWVESDGKHGSAFSFSLPRV
jgi:PAS domain S-box-containing protein